MYFHLDWLQFKPLTLRDRQSLITIIKVPMIVRAIKVETQPRILKTRKNSTALYYVSISDSLFDVLISCLPCLLAFTVHSPGLEIEKNMTRQFFSQARYLITCHFIFLLAKNGEVSYVVEMNVFMIGIYFKFYYPRLNGMAWYGMFDCNLGLKC